MRLSQNWFLRMVNRLRGRDPIKEYYDWLSQFGRVTEGQILDFQQSDPDITIYYNYQVANVDYETSQRLSQAQLSHKNSYIPGARVTVRYDPKQPGVSIVP